MVSALAGVFPVLYSFFDSEGCVNLDANDAQIDWAIASGASGITLLGLASEGGALPVADRVELVRRAALQVRSDLALLVTIRPDDSVEKMITAIGARRGPVGLIFQVGPDHEASLNQYLVARELDAPGASLLFGLQIAPGLIETDFTARSLAEHHEVVRQLHFLKAEYNSLELARDRAQLSPCPTLLVGKHGLNILDYLRIGATGVIPGVEMTGPLVGVLQAHSAGRIEAAHAAYGSLAGYVEFAMQDLATVVAVGKRATAIALGKPALIEYLARDDHFGSAVEFWALRRSSFDDRTTERPAVAEA